MKLKALCIATLLTFAGAGMAYAAPIVSNGDFSQITLGSATSPGASAIVVNVKNGVPVSNHITINDWTVTKGPGNGAQAVWYADIGGAEFGPGGPLLGNATGSPLPAPPTGGSFVGLNGDQGGSRGGPLQASLSQALAAGSLIEGQKYSLTFYWAAAQQAGVSGPTTDTLHVSLGGHDWITDTDSIGTHEFAGWNQVTYNFFADAADTGSVLLSFLNYGTPNGAPPMALLTGVSIVHTVPEPSALGIFGGGLLAMGFLTVFARRRALRKRDGETGTVA